jgi:hypothetical protein
MNASVLAVTPQLTVIQFIRQLLGCKKMLQLIFEVNFIRLLAKIPE